MFGQCPTVARAKVGPIAGPNPPPVRVAIYAKPRPDAEGQIPVYVRVSHRRVERLVALGLRVDGDRWNPRRREVRGRDAEARRVNELLEDRLRVATAAAEAELARLGRNVSADRLKAVLEQALHPAAEAEAERPVGVVALGRRIAAEKRAGGHPGTAEVYEVAMTNLEAGLVAQLGVRDLPVGAVTADVARAHERYLSATRGHAVNYTNRQLRTLRTVVRRAAADGVPGASVAAQAVGALRFKTERVAKARLSLDQVRELEALRPQLAGPKRDALDWFLFAFYAGGMRFGDLVTLRRADVERDGSGAPVYVRWRMRKTGDAQGVPLLPLASEVVAEWDGRPGPHNAPVWWEPGPFLFGMVTEAVAASPARLLRETRRWNARARKSLGVVSERAGVPYVGFHGARHSLADVLRRDGVPVPTISMVLGHSSVAQTERYLAGFDRQGVEDALRGALG